MSEMRGIWCGRVREDGGEGGGRQKEGKELRLRRLAQSTVTTSVPSLGFALPLLWQLAIRLRVVPLFNHRHHALIGA